MPRMALSRLALGNALAVALAAAYVTALALGAQGEIPLTAIRLVLPLPLILLVVALLRRTPLSNTQKIALGATSLVLLAALSAFLVLASWLTALVVPLMAIVAVVVARFPTATLVTILVFSGTYGSLSAFFDFPAAKVIDPLIGGLWLAAVWTWAVGRAKRRALLWPGLVVLIAYAAVTGAEILGSYNLVAGLQSFRGATWYMGVAVLIAYAPWPDHVRPKLLRAALVVAALVGAYATFRWAYGPAEEERQLALQNRNNLLDDELRPTGSFATSKELSAWMAMTIPFVAGMLLVMRGRWRLVALAATAACVTGMMAAGVRAGPAAAGAGVVLVLVLYQLSEAFRGRRGATVAIAVCATTLIGGGAFALTLGEKEDSGRRYSAIIDPGSDSSIQARLIKWRAAVDEIEEAPFGHGLGTSGRVQKRYGEFRNVGSIDVDNSYLKVAYEQGFFLMALLMAGFLLTLGGLIRRAVTSLNPERAGPAIAGAGTLLAMLVLFSVAEYIEGLPALAGWILVGIGLSSFTLGDPRTES